jgi:hypothetical protein
MSSNQSAHCLIYSLFHDQNKKKPEATFFKKVRCYASKLVTENVFLVHRTCILPDSGLVSTGRFWGLTLSLLFPGRV